MEERERRRRERKREKKEKRGIKRERKSFQEHEVMVLYWPPDPPAVPRPPTIMALAFRASCQPPLSQNPAYAPASSLITRTIVQFSFFDRNTMAHETKVLYFNFLFIYNIKSNSYHLVLEIRRKLEKGCN